jgi:hypothetical protein
MSSIREQVVAEMTLRLRMALPQYDIRRFRIRQVDRLDKPSVSIVLAQEVVVEDTLHDDSEVVLTVEVLIAASVSSDSEIDPVMTDVHREILADDTFGGIAQHTVYTGCTWTADEGGDGLAIVAAMTFDVTYLHDAQDMAEPA